MQRTMPLASRPSVHSFRRTALALLAVALPAVALACGDDPVAPLPSGDSAQFYWSLGLHHHAITLSTAAPFDTITLVAIPRTSRGEALADLPTPTFTSGDQDRLQVDADGVVHALRTGDDIEVIATLTVGNVTHADTARVKITADTAPPTLVALSIQPEAGDSAKYALSTGFFAIGKILAARPTTSSGDVLFGVPVRYESLDYTVATIDPWTGAITAVRTGPVTFVASTTVYGITRADTLPFTIGLPLVGIVNVRPEAGAAGTVFSPSTTTVGVGGTVIWMNPNDRLTDVTFDDPTNVLQDDMMCAILGVCGNGQIDAFGSAENQAPATIMRARRFPLPGDYSYVNTLSGATGTVHVVDEHQ